MAIVNPYDLLEDVDTDDTSKLLEKIAKKKAEEAAAALAAEAKKIAELREAAEKEDAERVAEGSYFKAPIVKETTKRAVVPSRGGDAARAQGNRGNGFRRNSGQNGYVNGLSGDSDHSMGDGIDNNVKGSGIGPQIGNGNGSIGGDNERPRRRQSEKRRDKADDKPNANNVVTEEPVNTAMEHSTINSEEVKKDESQELDANKAKEEEEKLMTLSDYEKIVEEKRKRLVAMRTTEERKVDLSKEFESMQQLSLKKGYDEIFVKLASDKDGEKGREVGKNERGTKQGSNKDGEKKNGKVKKVVAFDDIFTVKRERYSQQTRPRRQFTEGYEGQRSSPAAAPPSENQGRSHGNSQESNGISGGQRNSFGARSNDNQGNGRSDSQNFRGYGGQRNQARDRDDHPQYRGGRRAQAISSTPSLENPTDFPPLKTA